MFLLVHIGCHQVASHRHDFCQSVSADWAPVVEKNHKHKALVVDADCTCCMDIDDRTKAEVYVNCEAHSHHERGHGGPCLPSAFVYNKDYRKTPHVFVFLPALCFWRCYYKIRSPERYLLVLFPRFCKAETSPHRLLGATTWRPVGMQRR